MTAIKHVLQKYVKFILILRDAKRFKVYTSTLGNIT
jgi:hypothetical protein